jgi:hypothetical protein
MLWLLLLGEVSPAIVAVALTLQPVAEDDE